LQIILLHLHVRQVRSALLSHRYNFFVGSITSGIGIPIQRRNLSECLSFVVQSARRGWLTPAVRRMIRTRSWWVEYTENRVACQAKKTIGYGVPSAPKKSGDLHCGNAGPVSGRSGLSRYGFERKGAGCRRRDQRISPEKYGRAQRSRVG
jgi:hypothetical protein